MRRLGWSLNVISALFALAASVFWFASAADQPPALVAYWDAAPATDPFVRWMIEGIKWNRLAALSAGISAATSGIATALQMRQRNARLDSTAITKATP